MIVLITGKKGSGKTYLSKEITEDLRNIIYFDCTDDFKDKAELKSYPEVIECIKNRKLPVRYFSGDREKDEELFNFILNNVQGVTLLIDEFHLYTSRNLEKSYLNTIIRLSRHKKINIVGVTQRISDVSKTVLSQADTIVTFKQTENGDLETLRKYGFDIDKVKKLGKYKFIKKDI